MISEKLWYKNAVIYQLHVKCYSDSNGDGIGDFKGLTGKLDYIQTLGCNAIWIQPFYPSPLKDGGYDIAEYCDVHPDYGTLEDFKTFLTEAHSRGIKIITELVINHTSDQHAWFQRAREAKPGSQYRDYYVWSDTPEKYSEARIIFKDFETSNWTWDPVANAYYWHRFYSSQPDLNYDNPEIHDEIFKVLDFWMEMGVDGMRLDAIPYLYQRDGTDCENLPETHQFLKKLRAYVDSKYENRMLLAEANQWPEESAKYFGNEDECQMAYHFPVMPRLFMALKMEDRFPIIDIMEQTPSIADSCQWAMFLRNHDELTLEMVTDEERDFMYRSYAKDPQARINLGIRRRLSPLLENDRAKIELMNILLFSLPGSPIIYYGDEIGMGDNFYLSDRYGVRTPMQWDSSINSGFSDCNPQRLYLPLITDQEYHYTYLNVRNQKENKNSLLKWMSRIIALRQQHEVFGCGTLRFIESTNNHVLVFLREYNNERILVVANLSKSSQYVEIQLEEFANITPIDLFSSSPFNSISEGGYGLTLGRYGYYWLSLSKSKIENADFGDKSVPAFICKNDWKEIFNLTNKKKLIDKLLPEFLQQSRWYRAKSKEIESLEISQILESKENRLVFLKVVSKDGFEDEYHLPISFISLEEGLRLLSLHPRALICRIKVADQEGFLVDSFYNKSFQSHILEMVASSKKLNASGVSIQFTGFSELKSIAQKEKCKQSDVLKNEQTNTSIIYDNALICKAFRRVDEGVNPDFELTHYLYEEAQFHNVPKILGVIEKIESNKKSTLGTIQGYIPNKGDGWNYTLNALETFFRSGSPQIDSTYLDMISCLGKRTAEMHLALSSNKILSKDMIPEPFTIFYQNSLFQGMRSKQKKVFSLLKSKLNEFEPNLQRLAKNVIEQESNIIDLYKKLLNRKFNVNKIRTHGDYHLGQILIVENDVIIFDFEGEPLLSISERKLKKCCFHDVAGMIRSFHYAAITSLNKQEVITKESYRTMPALWYKTVTSQFLKTYLETIDEKNQLIPNDPEELKILIDTHLMSKAINELNYELNTRPEWIFIPLKGILMLSEEICCV